MLACRLAIAPAATNAAPPDHLHGALAGSLALLTLASFGILVSRTLELNGGVWSTLWPDMALALKVTHFGHYWLWRVPALVVAWLAWVWWARRRDTPALWLLALAVAAVAMTRSETGHPADHGNFTAAVWVDWLHILAAGTWVGSIIGMTLAVFPRLLRAGARAVTETAEIFQRLSTLSGVALTVLVGAGIFSVTQQLGGVASLWTSRYGAALDVKLGIVLVMIGIGAHNRYFKLPRLLQLAGRTPRTGPIAWIVHTTVVRNPTGASSDSGHTVIRACARAVLIEAVLGFAVIGATAVLIHAMPPADMPAHMRMNTSMALPTPTHITRAA